MSRFYALAIMASVLAPFSPAMADPLMVNVTIKDHRFVPAEQTIQAGQFTKLIVHNADPTAEEFESADLSREKLVPPGGEIILTLGRLPPGTYQFFGDYHPDSAQGKLVVTK